MVGRMTQAEIKKEITRLRSELYELNSKRKQDPLPVAEDDVLILQAERIEEMLWELEAELDE